MPHLYLQNSRCEVCKLGESSLSYVDVPRSLSAPGARINDSNKNAFSGSIAYYDHGISESVVRTANSIAYIQEIGSTWVSSPTHSG